MDLERYSEEDLDRLFELAYIKVSETEQKFPQDVLLYFYAYYKQAKNESDLKVTQNPINGEQLVDAFKANAIFQVKRFTKRESKIRYIQLARLHLEDEFPLE
ncbi:acyl-CoA-binding protein [Psychroflexus sediminis]|uniref:Acyl CoA binding protein n=1 Tax=Psychroflexus sediminis TaxID=470826 RepID=A0A1G7V532_9FLAO|nr:acyl-CoA-binding protein [Psychroflexus sediminis]SDG54866.1 Acyl CoA binding protein [Psychroflexus sediminis]